MERLSTIPLAAWRRWPLTIPRVRIISNIYAQSNCPLFFLPAEMIKDSARPSYWVPDAESPHCFICKTVFGHSKDLELELAHKANNKNSSSSSSSSGSNLTPTIDVRRHHCRRCGQAICSGCSKSRMPVPERGWIMEVRVCDSCACVPRASTASNGSNSAISSAISDAINGDESAHEQHSLQYTDDNRRRRSSSSGGNDHRNGNAPPAGQHVANNDKNDNDNCNSVTIWSKCSGKR